MRENYLFDYLVPKNKKCSGRTGGIQAKPQSDEQAATLAELSARLTKCSRCGLRTSASQVVSGEGNSHARLMFIGEGPGAEEDARGLPFVGPAGQLLNKILAAAEISREEVYITNVVKCRPPANRQPQKDEIAICLEHLQQQIKLIHPAIIVCLGSVATQALIDPSVRVSAVRGRWFEKDGIRFMPTFHPAALLRDPAKKKPVWDDIQKIRDAYRLL